MKSTPAGSSVESSRMRMLEGQPTEVVRLNIINFPNILTLNMISSVFKFWVYGGVCLHQFADSLLFDMMLKTAYHDGVDTPQDLIDRDMSLGIIESGSQSVN